MSSFRRFRLGKSERDVDVVLRDLVWWTYSHVPVYRRLWQAAGVTVARFCGAADLPTLPIMTKETLLSSPLETRLSEHADPRRTIRRSTSGTSGAPLDIHMSRLEFRFRQLVLLLAMWGDARWALPLTVAEAGAWIPPDGSGTVRVKRTPVARIIYISRRIPLEDQLQALLDSKPSIVTGSPTSLEMIASELERLGASAPRPRVVATRGEVLHPEVRRLLSRVFACPIRDYYNAQEVGNIARECPNDPGVLHVTRDACIVEVVDASGRRLPPGEEGSVVVTSLYNQTMPFVRYALRDRASLLPESLEPCACGRVGARISPPAGRDDDLLVLPDGRRLSPRVMDDLVIGAFRHVGLETSFTRGVREYQIVQESASHIRVLLQAGEPLPPALGEQLSRAVLALNPEIRCDVESVSQIEVGQSGKRKRVVSRVQAGT